MNISNKLDEILLKISLGAILLGLAILAVLIILKALT